MTTRTLLRRDDPRFADYCMRSEGTIRDAIERIDRNQQGIVLIVEDGGRFLNTVTDGDIRRAMLHGHGLDAPIAELLRRKATSPYPTPITALEGTDDGALLRMMMERRIRQVPLLDENGGIAGLTMLDQLVGEALPLRAVIMAGGRGARLRPLTDDVPKPMLPVGDRPLMQRIVERLRDSGIRRVNVTTHFRADKIIDHFGNGEAFGVELSYLQEDTPLGTAGALGLLRDATEPLLVINGDILTDVDFRAMSDFHREHAADITVAVRRYEVQVPYGVLETDGAMVCGLTEKPLMQFMVNAGIYLLEPSVHRWIPENQPLAMTDLIQQLLDNGRPVASFPVREYWLDIGQPADYEQAQQDARARQVSS